jgi:hypothetical protein
MKKIKSIMSMAATIITLLIVATLSSCEGGEFIDPGTAEYLGGGEVTGGFVPPSGGGGGRHAPFTLTNIPSEYVGYYAQLSVGNSYSPPVVGRDPSNFDNKYIKITGSSVKFNLYESYYSFVFEDNRYSDNDTHNVYVEIYYESTEGGSDETIHFSSVTFKNGSATKSWKDNDW